MRVSGIELRLLRDFVAVVEQRSFRAAAVKMHVSQPPLTRHIQQLEEALGTELLIRHARGVELTDAGTSYYEDAKHILALNEQAAERALMAGQGQIGRLDVGVFGSAMFNTIPQIVQEFRLRYPRVEIAMHNLDRDSQTKAVRERRISVAFNRLYADEPDLRQETVHTERLHLALQVNHPLAARAELGLKDVVDQTLILYPHISRPSFIDYALRLFHQLGVQPGDIREVDDLFTAISMVASGVGITLVTDSACSLKLPGIRYIPIRKRDKAVLDLTIIYRAGDSSPLLAAFLNVVRKFSRGFRSGS
ncbi:LysR substrate-binding domain-containing protein [Nevskia ramosa]|uniref:LysR substrate-binding domain-containing protein n=1 Tax=Nevskia ramosa TaxID=64002 RepID=UPI0025E473E9|nr:LysR substrate-binding domain-containing protein [uncultured Nevskia sp.]